MLSVTILVSHFTFCHTECHYAECRNDECRYAVCHNAKCIGTPQFFLTKNSQPMIEPTK
jgi:hypothetical protein